MQVHQQRAQLKLLVRRARQFAPAVASEVATLAWSNPDAALTTFVRAFEREHFELDETVCEQGFDFWVDAASEFIPMLMRGTDRCNGIEPLGYRPGFTLMWALIENVFYGDERSEVIAEVAAAFGDELANRLEATHPPEHFALRSRLVRTPYVGLYLFSCWALGDVRNPLLLYHSHHASELLIPWTRRGIARAARLVRQADNFQAPALALARWLELAPSVHGALLADAALGRLAAWPLRAGPAHPSNPVLPAASHPWSAPTRKPSAASFSQNPRSVARTRDHPNWRSNCMRSTSDQREVRPHPEAGDAQPSPWPPILERPPEYEPDTLLLSLEFYRESVLRRLIDEDGRQSLALVDIAEVARALSAGVSLSSGLLPGDDAGLNSLFWSRSNGSSRFGIWVGPRIWRLVLHSPEPGGKDRRLRLPFPGLLFVCRPDASGAYVFAAPKRPRGLDAPLFHCPTPNVFPNGRICPGDHAFARDPLKLPSEFFLSRFRNTGDTRGGKSKKHPDDVTRLWDELSGLDTFPANDLVPILTLQQACDLAV